MLMYSRVESVRSVSLAEKFSDRRARVALFEVVKSLRLDWNTIYKSAFTDGFVPGTGYESNFGAGRISQARSEMIAVWLRDHHPEAHLELEARMQQLADPAPSTAGWEKWVVSQGRFGAIDVGLVLTRPQGVVGLAPLEPVAEQRIRLGQSFAFRIVEPLDGTVLAFQSSGQGWYPLPLASDGLQTAILPDQTALPIDPESGAVVPLVEDRDHGRHRFVFLVGRDDLIAAIAQGLAPGRLIPPAFLNGIAERLQAGRGWTLHRLNVLFVQ